MTWFVEFVFMRKVENSLSYVLEKKFILVRKYDQDFDLITDIRAQCYCASLVRMLYMTWRVPRHVFQARAPSRNSTKYRADDLCDNLICEYFFGCSVTPTFFRQITSFSDSFRYTKKPQKNLYVGSFNYFSLYYSHKIEFVHGYRSARLRSVIF